MIRHLPALLFCIPLVTAISLPLIGRKWRRGCRPLALAAVVSMTAVAAANLWSVLNYGEVRYAFGGWAAPVGIEWVADGLAGIVMMAICLLATLSALCGGTVTPDPAGSRVVPYYSLVLLLLAGLTGVVFSADLFNVFVFLEVVGLSTAALIGMAGGKGLVFGFRYLILTSLGATFYLLGLSFFYAATGTLNMADLAERVPELLGSKAVIGGLVFMFIGLGVKMALMPLHAWLPDAYTHAPDSVSPLLSAVVTKVALLAWVRILYWAIGCSSELEKTTHILLLVQFSGAMAAVVGAFLALTQRDLKRVFAYGGISHIGLILIGAGQGNQTGLVAAMFYLINDAVMQAALFVVAGAAIHQYGVTRMEDLGKLRRQAPWMIGALIVVATSMIGIPPTGGFFGKWYIILSALKSGNYLSVAAVMLATLLTMAWFTRIWMLVFADVRVQPASRAPEKRDPPPALWFALGALTAGIVGLGLFSDRIVNALLDATASLGLGN